jgi:hypothetical protein
MKDFTAVIKSFYNRFIATDTIMELWSRTVVSKVGCTAPCGTVGLPRRALRDKRVAGGT